MKDSRFPSNFELDLGSKCAGCDCFSPEIEEWTGMTVGGSERVHYLIHCEQSELCDSLENRIKRQMEAID